MLVFQASVAPVTASSSVQLRRANGSSEAGGAGARRCARPSALHVAAIVTQIRKRAARRKLPRCAIVTGMRHRAWVSRATLIATVVVSVGVACPALAQEHVTLQGEFLFYGDDTEFRNPFREGETIFGSAVKAAAAFDVNDRVRVSLGAFGNLRFGGDDAFEEAKPVVALTVTGQRSSFVFG